MAMTICKAVFHRLALLTLVAAPAELAAQDETASAVTWAPAPSTIIIPSQQTLGSAWEPYRENPLQPVPDAGLQDSVLDGAIDIHAHFGPDAYPRSLDAFEIAELAQAHGMRAIVLKNHWSESAGLAKLARDHADAPGLEVFGGLVLNATVGGINPQAVRYFAEVDGGFGKVVWMPTHDSQHEVEFLEQNRPYVAVSRDGELLPAVLEVLDLIKQYDLTLATGHVTAEEMVAIVDEAKQRGIERIIITHPGMGPMYTDPTLDQLRQVTQMGAFAEITTAELNGERNRESAVNVIRELGPEHVIIASDSGLVGLPNHTDALVLAARVLREEGFGEEDLARMFKHNPARVLGLPPLLQD
jgi:hypothetical protein